MTWFRRLINAVRSERVSRDIDRELSFHLTERVDELVAGGMSAEEAWREARRRFGDREVLKERVREVDVLVWLESLLADVRYGVQAMRATPGFTLVAVLSLGLGIGANTSIFSLINAVMLRSLPVQRPGQLVQVEMGEGGGTFTNPLWEQIRDRRSESLAGTLAFSDQLFNLSDGGVVRRAPGAAVSGDYFNVLGVLAQAGRILGPLDDVRGCRGVVVLSDGFSQREYGEAAEAVGRTILLGGHSFEVVGVAASGFSGIHVGRAADVFIPICAVDILNTRRMLDARSTWWLSVFGRLRSGHTLAQAQAELGQAARVIYEATIPTHWTADEQREYAEGTLSARSAASGLSLMRGQYREALFTLLIVVGVVLLIACANVAQLLMARATSRRHEVAVKLALGAGAARLVRQLLTESLLLALLGGAVGILFARWSSAFVVGFLSVGRRAVWLDLSIDFRVLAFTLAVATATGILFGLAPAWRTTQVDAQMALRGAGRGVVGDSNQRFSRSIVVAQVALSLVLITAAGLLVGSFRRLTAMDPGFRRDGVLLMDVNWSRMGLDAERSRALPRTVLEHVRAVPGVRSASASLIMPISGTSWNDNIEVEGYTPENPRDGLVWFNAVTDGYLETLGTRLLAGRDLSPQDRTGSMPVVLVNRAMARRFFGEANPLGKSLRTNVHDSISKPMTIVGVVEDAKYRTLDEGILPTAYVPLDQAELFGPSVQLALRSDGPPSALVPALTGALHDVSPAISIEYGTLDEQVSVSLARPRLMATLSGFFGALALLLAVIGLYGTMSYSVARRRNEIGIRIALGAARTGILGMVASEAGKVIVLGVLFGALLALAATRLVATFLYGVTPTDPLTLGLSALALAAVALLAGLVPAWRAAAVDPMVALRQD